MRKETTIRGINLVYEDLGAGPVILLIHGQPFNRTMWEDQKAMLHKTHRLIIPDLRCYGESEVTDGIVLLDELALDLIHLLDLLAIDTAVVIGLSMGGQIALELYRLKPALFQGIVLADTKARAEDEKSYQNRLKLAAQIVEDGMEKFTDDRIKHFMCPSTFETKPQVIARVAHMMKTTSAAGSAAVQRGRAERLDYTPLLEKIDFPALIIVGDQDEFTPLASATYMHERITNSTLAIIANSGHISNMEQPAAFNRNLENFLNTF
jgi:pimeloyl-ACP methyl ester carboxylesterase